MRSTQNSIALACLHPTVQEEFRDLAQANGKHCYTCASLAEAKALLQEKNISALFYESPLTEEDTYSAIAALKAVQPEIRLYLIAGDRDLQPEMRALAAGADSLLKRPLLAQPFLEALRQLEATVESPEKPAPHALIGESAVMQKLRQDISRIAPTDARILLSGENGTGKEVVAEMIHSSSARAQAPLVKINCAALPGTLIESELFGYEAGAFTGADARKTGLIEQADSGTLLLDEIGDMALETQAKVLRVLQENAFVRVGGREPIAFDVRFLAATNKDLRQEVREGRFRKDLFYRLSVIPLQLPALRQRGDDVLLLLEHFLPGSRQRLTDEAVLMLRNYDWPGNVRELSNLAERIQAMLPQGDLNAGDLVRLAPDLQNVSAGSAQTDAGHNLSLKERLNLHEKHILQEAYQEAGRNISKMARLLKTDRANLHRKLIRYKIR